MAVRIATARDAHQATCVAAVRVVNHAEHRIDVPASAKGWACAFQYDTPGVAVGHRFERGSERVGQLR